MKNSIMAKDINDIFEEIKIIMVDNKDYLIELDAQLGDGDLGLTMMEGFTRVAEESETISDTVPGVIVKKAGMVMAAAVPSTMGTLVATGMMRAGKSVENEDEIFLDKLVVMGYAAVEGIAQRGKAVRGEKTILDSLYPAVEALEEFAAAGSDLKGAIYKAYEAAVIGVEETKTMKAVHGRAAWHSEKSIGKQDPGATVGMLILKGLVNWIDKQS